MQKITNNQIKFVASLKMAKFRKEHNLFVVEGEKIIAELLNGEFEIHSIYGTEEWLQENELKLEKKQLPACKVSPKELERLSGMKSPNKVLAVVKMPSQRLPQGEDFDDLILTLDKIQDPGNLGTIIRTADWFEIKHIVCSNDTVDVFNPKVIQATMGSFMRVKIHYTELSVFFTQQVPEGTKIYGALLNGKNIYNENPPRNCILLIGNESQGISREIEKFVTHKISIPAHANARAESLNASVAAGILMGIFRQ